MKKATLILKLFFASIIVFSQTQNIVFDKITVKDGLLNAMHIRCLLQDHKGFIWIGSWGVLQRYDGYEFRNYQLKQLNGNVNKIIEDRNGLLWLSTENGIYLINPENDNMINYVADSTDARMYKILEDKNGIIWCATFNGLLKMEPKVKEADNLKELIFNNGIASAYQISVYKLFENSDIEYSNAIPEIYEDSQGRLWAGSTRGLYIFSKETNEFIRIDDDVNGKTRMNLQVVFKVAEENHDILWVYTMGGTSKISNIQKAFSNRIIDKSALDFTNYTDHKLIQPGAWNIDFIPSNEDMSWISSYTFLIDSHNNFWYGSHYGLVKMTVNEDNRAIFEKVYTDLYESEGIGFSMVMSIMEDRTGLLWTGHEYPGIKKFRSGNNPFTPLEEMLRKYPRLRYDFYQVYEDDGGNLWICTLGTGIFKITSEGKVSNYRATDSNPQDVNGNITNSILELEKGIFWIGTITGIRQFDNNTGIWTKVNTPFLNDTLRLQILHLYRIGNYIIIESWKELYVYDLRTNKSIKHSIENYNTINLMGLKGSSFTAEIDNTMGLKGSSFTAGNFRSMLCVTDSLEICRMSMNQTTGELTYTPLPESVTKSIRNQLEGDQRISGIYEFKKGKFWLISSSPRTLIELNTESGEIQKWTESDGISDEGIVAAEEDNNGNLWLVYNYGLAMLDAATGIIRTFDIDDGLPGVRHNFYSLKDSKGFMYFGGVGGIYRIDPNNLNKNNVIPSIVITDFRLFNKSIKVDSTRKAVLTSNIYCTKEINLAYNQNDLSFTFVALDYNDPSENRYAYMLEGYQKEWIETDADDRTANYTNLNPGKYVFRVKGSNNDGVWNEEGTFINIIIHPPFWKTIWAYFAYAIIILLLLRGYIYWRTRSLRKEKSLLENEVNKRTEELHEVNTLLEEQNEELMQQKEEIQTTLENLQKTQEQLIESEKMAALGGLVAGVAHEINTPVGIGVTAISNLMEEVQEMAEHYKKDEISRKNFKEFLQSTYDASKLIQKNLERTASLIQSFKQVSVDQVSEQQRVFNLKSYFNDIIRSLSPKFKHKHITFNIECDDKLEVDSFPGAYSQIFTNLLLNSFTHGFHEREKGVVNINANKDNNMLILEYRDDGAGISKKDLPHIFEPFYTSDQHRGTGLGLNIVHNLVKQKLHGNITCESESGKGVVFVIKLPVTP